MARQCMRPGCDRPVAAQLAYDPVELAVWLDPPTEGDEPVQQVCSQHAGSLTAPRGWSLTDRRPPAPAAVLPRAAPSAPTLRSVPPPAAPAAEVEVEVERDAVAPLEPVEPAAPPVEATPQRPRHRKAKRNVATRPRAAKKGKDEGLLGRAFAWTGPQHSVLTQPAQPDDEAAPEGGSDEEGPEAPA